MREQQRPSRLPAPVATPGQSDRQLILTYAGPKRPVECDEALGKVARRGDIDRGAREGGHPNTVDNGEVVAAQRRGV
ncbi:hypothetical protein GCM10010528_00450 [Gordonia defluvii]|uniref:Uncharacterized protein n=1 Tax=Gordonia defluvii TaxID=283718 RepID=A0ABP6KWT5_9ACTN